MTRAWRDRTRRNYFKLKKKFFIVRTGCSEKMWMPDPWKCSRPAGWCFGQCDLVEGVPAHKRRVVRRDGL